MGGYGGASGRNKGKCYYDTGGHKVKDPNAIAVAEYYINKGEYVAFLQEKPNVQQRADLSVEGVHVEVKGMSSLNPSKVANRIDEAFEQVDADNYRYPISTHRPGRVVILSKYPSLEVAKDVVTKGFEEAKRKNFVSGEVYLFHDGIMYLIG